MTLVHNQMSNGESQPSKVELMHDIQKTQLRESLHVTMKLVIIITETSLTATIFIS